MAIGRRYAGVRPKTATVARLSITVARIGYADASFVFRWRNGKMRALSRSLLTAAWSLARDSALAFIADEALSRGAAIAYYTIFSIAPVLVLVIAIAGFAFGEVAATGAIAREITGMMGRAAADMLQEAIRSATGHGSGLCATAVGILILLITASGVFGEMQSALNAIWKAAPPRTAFGHLVRARLVSLGLVAALGFLLLVSLVISTVLALLGTYFSSRLPFSGVLLQGFSFVISFALITTMFAAIYKILPDKTLEWRDVAVGATATALLFTFGKYLISLYIGTTAVASTYGAAGGLIVLLLWIYYSAQIFLLGAEFTKVYASRHGSHHSIPR